MSCLSYVFEFLYKLIAMCPFNCLFCQCKYLSVCRTAYVLSITDWVQKTKCITKRKIIRYICIYKVNNINVFCLCLGKCLFFFLAITVCYLRSVFSILFISYCNVSVVYLSVFVCQVNFT